MFTDDTADIKPASPTGVINDINGDLIPFYRQVKYHLDPLLDEPDGVLNSRKEFTDSLAQPGLTESKWLLTCQDCPLARKEFRHCHISPVERQNGIGNTATKSKRVCRELDIRKK
jgi:site-specific DNA-adenine methylase